jgi:uncharacterized iron-regulated membrane protein
MLHTYLLLGTKGFSANGVGGLLTGVLVLSGLWLWWPRTVRQLIIRSTFKRNAGAERLNADLHNVFGAYALPLLLVLALTGSVLVFYFPVQKAVFAWTKTVAPPPDPVVEPPASAATRLPVETLLTIARNTIPGGTPTAVNYPTRPEQPLTIDMELTLTGFANYADVSMDPYTGRVLHATDERNMTAGARVMRVLCNLHFGWWGGIVTKMLYALTGVIPLALYVTGILIYSRKLRKRKTESVDGYTPHQTGISES